MAKGYKQLTLLERSQIDALKKRGDSHTKIAKQLGRDRRTIDREVKSNTGQRGYRHKQAQAQSDQRRHKSKPHLVKLTLRVIQRVKEKLTLYQWSPEPISGWLKREGSISISHERI